VDRLAGHANIQAGEMTEGGYRSYVLTLG